MQTPVITPDPLHRTPGVPSVHWEQWDEMVAPYSSCVRAPSPRTQLSHASSVTRVMRETRPGDAAPCLLLRVTFTGKSRAWCETGADAPFTSAAARTETGSRNGEWLRENPMSSGYRARDYDNYRHWSEVTLRPCCSPITASVASCLESQSDRELFLVSDIISRCHHQNIFSKSSDSLW